MFKISLINKIKTSENGYMLKLKLNLKIDIDESILLKNSTISYKYKWKEKIINWYKYYNN